MRLPRVRFMMRFMGVVVVSVIAGLAAGLLFSQWIVRSKQFKIVAEYYPGDFSSDWNSWTMTIDGNGTVTGSPRTRAVSDADLKDLKKVIGNGNGDAASIDKMETGTDEPRN